MERVFRKIICLLTMTTVVSTSFSNGVYAVSASASDQEAIAEMAAVVEMEQDLEARLDTFLAVCSDDEGMELAPTGDYSCALEAEVLEPLLLELEAEGGIVSDVTNPSCAQVEEVASLPVIKDLKDELTDELQCRREDVEHYKSSCAQEFNCNVLRSGISAAKALPDVIEKPVADYLTSQVSEMEGNEHCLDDSRSNCLTEVWTTFIANIKDTAQSFWELGKLGWETLWNLDGFFDRKSDEVHLAASQTKEDVVTFWKSPGAWAYQQFMKMKDSVEEWMKNSVFCQKWKGTPHMEDSVCEVPLETFGCVNCGDMTNAFCAASGVLASELMIVFATAGAGAAVGTGTRLGLRVAGATALKASSKIASVAPKMMKLAPNAAKSNKVTRTSKVAIEATIETARVAVRISSEKMAQAKELFIRYKDGLMDTKIAKVAIRTADLASMPMILLDKAAEKGIVASERLMSRVIPGTTGRYLRRREAMRRIPSNDDSPNSRMRQRVQFAMRHQARSMRHVAGYDGKDTPRSRSNPSTTESRGSSENRPQSNNQDFNDNRFERDERRRREVPGQADERGRNSDSRSTKERLELEAKTAERERARRAEEVKAEAANNSHNNEKKNESSTSHLGSALAAADIGVKGLDFSGDDDIESAELERLVQEKESGVERMGDIKTSEDAIKAIVGDLGTPAGATSQNAPSDAQVRERYQQLQDTYSDENRSNYVENAVAATGISSAEAQNFFDRRKSEVDKAGNLLFPKPRVSAKRSALQDLQAQLAGLDSDMNELEDNLVTPLAQDKGKRPNQLGEDEDEDEFREDFVGESDSGSRSFASSSSVSSPSAVAALGGVGGGVSSSGSGLGSGSATMTPESELLAAPGSWEAIRGEEISSNETKILESLINVNALRFVNGEPSEFTEIKKQLGLEVEGVLAHGKIRSSQGEFLFIHTQDKYLVFKKKQGSWVKVQSASLERLLKRRVIATRS